MKRETRIGLLAIVTIAIIAVGYNFLKGNELFSSTNTYRVVYDNVDQLAPGDIVTINGLRVGQVTEVVLNPENVRSLIVALTLDEDLPVPKSARALIKSDGLLGGKFVSLEFDRACTGPDCAEDGDFLTAAEEGLLAGFLGDPAELQEYTNVLRDAAGPIIDSITNRTDTNGIGRTLRNLEATSQNLAALTYKMDRILARSGNSLASTIDNVEGITGNLEANNGKIESILRNVDSTTAALARVNLEGTLASVEATLASLQTTLSSTDETIKDLNGLTGSLNEGEGTLGKLIKDDDVYVRLDRAMANLDLLLQDFRLNPKRYVNVSVFGKKQKEYDYPEDDPAAPVVPDLPKD